LIPNRGSALRSNLHSAWQKVANISSTPLKGLVRFASAAAIAAAILAENSNGVSVARTDLASDPTTCVGYNSTTCTGKAECGAPAGKMAIGGGTADFSDRTVVSGTLSVTLFNEAVEEIQTALSEVDVGGKFDTGISSFIS